MRSKTGEILTTVLNLLCQTVVNCLRIAFRLRLAVNGGCKWNRNGKFKLILEFKWIVVTWTKSDWTEKPRPESMYHFFATNSIFILHQSFRSKIANWSLLLCLSAKRFINWRKIMRCFWDTDRSLFTIRWRTRWPMLEVDKICFYYFDIMHSMWLIIANCFNLFPPSSLWLTS